MTAAWTEGVAPSWGESQGLTTPRVTFFYLTGAEEIPLSNQATRYVIDLVATYAGLQEGDYYIILNAAYYYLNSGYYRTTTAALASIGGTYAKSRHVPVSPTEYHSVATTDGFPTSVMRREIVGEDSWRWVIYVYSTVYEDYLMVWVGTEKHMPGCAFWVLADDFGLQVASGFWGTLSAFAAVSPARKHEDFVYAHYVPKTSRFTRIFSRTPTCITISGGNEADRVRGPYFLLDETATGNDRVWIHGPAWHNNAPHRPIGDNARLRAMWSTLPSPLWSGEKTFATQCAQGGWNYAIIRHTGTNWVLVYNESVTWTASGDPTTDGTIWTGAVGHSDCRTRPWNSWHQDITTRYGVVRNIITDSIEAAMVEIAAMYVRLIPVMPTPLLYADGSFGLYAKEVVAMPDRVKLGLRLDTTRWSDVHNDYLVHIGIEESEVVSPRAKSYGVFSEQDHKGQTWAESFTPLAEDLEPYTGIHPATVSFRHVAYGLYRCKVEDIVEVGWDTSDPDNLQDYQDAFEAGYYAGINDGYADYPTFAGTEPTQPNTDPEADGAARGGYAGYLQGFLQAERDDQISGYNAGVDAGLAQAAIDDPNYNNVPPDPPAGTETYQDYWRQGWSAGYDMYFGYGWAEPPPPYVPPDWGAVFYVPSPYWVEVLPGQNITGLNYSIGASGVEQATASGTDTGQYIDLPYNEATVRWYWWETAIMTDIDIDVGQWAQIIDSEITVPEDTATRRYTPVQGAGGSQWSENGLRDYLTRTAPILRPTGSATFPKHEFGLYDSSKVTSGYVPPALPPVYPP